MKPTLPLNIERFWKTMKNEFGHRLLPWAPLPSSNRRLSRYLAWFNRERVHQGLGFWTPDEVHREELSRPLHAI